MWDVGRLSLFVREAVEAVNQVVDLGVGCGDFALQAVEFRGREFGPFY
jgi:predicted RNA methylase